tara:strand:- start:84 stop:404 length:321 start_codon:yes stop_codon:yes gene_type:complete
VADLIESFVSFMGTDEQVTGPINLGNPRELTMINLAELVIELTGSSSPIKKAALPEDDPRQRRPDITKARKFLDWRPRVEIEEGLLLTIKYFEDILSKGSMDLTDR